MHIQFFIFPALMVVAYIGAWIKAPLPTLGGTIGGLLGVLIPFLGSEIYVWRGGDPTAAGVFSFFCILTLPLGIAIGVLIARRVQKRKKPSDQSKI